MARDLMSLWPRLKPTAQQALCWAADQLVEGKSGLIELMCKEGGVRKVRIGSEFTPSEMEYRLGVEDEAPIRDAEDKSEEGRLGPEAHRSTSKE